MLNNRVILIAFFALLIPFPLLAQNPVSVHGYVFGDYFYKLGGNNQQASVSQYSTSSKSYQAFELRRLYLYFDKNLSESFNAQFLLEGNEKIFESGGRHSVFIKSAYLQWKNIFGKSDLTFGIVPTPTWTWAGSEKLWNYRAVEKTVTDFRGMGAANDIGVSLKGKLDDEGMFSYVAMIGNGNSSKPETNKYKKYYGTLIVKPIKEVVLDAYVDYEPGQFDLNRTTLKGVAAYQDKNFTIGVEAVQQTRNKAGAGGTDVIPSALSLFGWLPIPGSENLRAFLRFDSFDPNTNESSKGYKESFVVFGVNYLVNDKFHLMPNVWINSFSPKDPSVPEKDSDVVLRMTFHYYF